MAIGAFKSVELFSGVKYLIFQTIQNNSYLILFAQPHAGPEDFLQREKDINLTVLWYV
jgi:hypothetical protein